MSSLIPTRVWKEWEALLLVNVNSEYVYAFPDIAFVPGTLKAVATKNGKVVAQQELHAGKLNTTTCTSIPIVASTVLLFVQRLHQVSSR